MSLVTLANLRFGHGTRLLLDGVSGSIHEGERVGLVGRNGCGKSTLFKLIAGLIKPDDGEVQIARTVRIGYLEQDPKLPQGKTLRGAAAEAFAVIEALKLELEQVYDRMGTADAAELEKLMNRQVSIEERIDAAGGYAIDHKIDAALHGLGFTDDDFDLPISGLSGGQKARLGLARLLLSSPDLLLLDEPTNHLDIEGRRWLEEFLADEFKGSVVLISHDRWLLDRVVNRIIEIDRGVLREYPGNYAAFRALRAERMLTVERQHEKQQDRIRQEQAFIDRYRAGQRAKQARGRESRLERFKEDSLVEKHAEMGVMNLDLPDPPPMGDFAFVAEDIAKSFGDRVCFRNLMLSARPGDRIGIIGPNGAGKTTLVRTLLGDLESDSGEIKRSPRLSIGWFRQTQDHIDRTVLAWEFLQNTIRSLEGAPRASEQEARNLAGAFLFTGEEQDKAIGDLSGGERGRLVLASLIASAKNLLVLDEPTNHLDIPSAERLEEALDKFGDVDRTKIGGKGGHGGVLLLISHDRALLDDVCDKFVILDGAGNARVFEGSYRDWEAKQKAEASEAVARAKKAETKKLDTKRTEANGALKSAAAKSAAPTSASATASSSGKTSSATHGASNKSRSKYSNLALEKIEARISEIGRELMAIDFEFADPKTAADSVKTKKLLSRREELGREQSELEEEWIRKSG
ncbi:MAG: ABC-F family ATP-binding cassette domain-containing protein [Limnohabitans sp.]|jgi:ATP-binding cassette subfamily F protein 3|nr:ABC-F family ATP-binding cassette domain-containing protein [Limnohabitans sp.]